MKSFQRSSILFLVSGALGAACTAATPAPEPGARPAAESANAVDASVPIEVFLQRKAPGLIVTRMPGGEIAIEIRNSSARGGEGTSPLFMLDGVPFEPGPGGVLRGIDPSEIATFKVLRPAESGLYGSQGLNGVVLITTKRAPKRSPGRESLGASSTGSRGYVAHRVLRQCGDAERGVHTGIRRHRRTVHDHEVHIAERAQP